MQQISSSRRNVLSAIVERWQRWKERRDHLYELDSCQQEVELIASDLGMSAADLRRTAAKGPDAARELYDRLAALRFDRQSIEPVLMRDLERVCTQCDAKRRCRSDLARGSVSLRDAYCPNDGTLAALAQQGR